MPGLLISEAEKAIREALKDAGVAADKISSLGSDIYQGAVQLVKDGTRSMEAVEAMIEDAAAACDVALSSSAVDDIATCVFVVLMA